MTLENPYEGRSKLREQLGTDLLQLVAGKDVLDFGCGRGREVIEIAALGASRAVGIEIQKHLLSDARLAAKEAGVEHLVAFVTDWSERVDVIVSLDAFEHFSDPAAVLVRMSELLKSDGRILISFGPPWLHPYGGHLFSVFPWAHLIFTERTLIRWRSDFKIDGARTFSEVAGGLNQMTISRFRRLVRESAFEFESFSAVPIRKARAFHCLLTREFLSSVVRCSLRLKA